MSSDTLAYFPEENIENEIGAGGGQALILDMRACYALGSE